MSINSIPVTKATIHFLLSANACHAAYPQCLCYHSLHLLHRALSSGLGFWIGEILAGDFIKREIVSKLVGFIETKT